ncbi:hypothetical protein HJFPF1_08547 [Paramyrothecium foliicola]|nr:hypothetical protein HJFPF1_08547 [Paramyrothecium foliicola]
METVLETSYDVQLGFWRNWSRGYVFGATLTLTRSEASLLIAFTSIFLAFAGNRFWRIICLALHYSFSNPDPGLQDGLYHQRQLILRNSHTAESGLRSLILLFVSWRRATKSALSRTLLPILLAVISFSGFIVAGGFSAVISTSVGSEILIKSNSCGMLGIGLNSTNTWFIDTPYRATQIANAVNYAQQCYSSTSSSVLECATYVTPSLPARIDVAAGCPFNNGNGICKNSSSNLLLDTTYMDSNKHFGLNAPSTERVYHRETFHCAPLTTKGYSSPYTHPSGHNYTRYNYGSAAVGSRGNMTFLNYTMEVDSLSTQYPPPTSHRTVKGRYLASALGAFSFNGTHSYELSAFEPNDDLKRDDADVFIFFLSGNGMYFIEPTLDPWYRATTPGPSISSLDTAGRRTIFTSDEASSPLACATQYQFCRGDPTESGDASNCGPLAGQMDAMVGAAPLFDMPADLDAILSSEVPSGLSKAASSFHWYLAIWQMTGFAPHTLFNTLGQSSLSSQQSIISGVQGPLPNNQWQTDITRLWNTSRATYQASFVNTAKGVSRLDYQQYLMKPSDDQQRHLCTSQKIRSSRFGSFSVFGLCFTYIVGFLIISISFSMEPILRQWHNYLQRKPHGGNFDRDGKVSRDSYRFLEWVTNGTLQQHRLAQEGLGWCEGGWKGCTDENPTTITAQGLGSLDARDPNHPILYAPVPVTDVYEDISDAGKRPLSTHVSHEAQSSVGEPHQDDYRVSSIAASPKTDTATHERYSNEEKRA